MGIHGINFQYYDSIDLVAIKNVKYEINGKKFIYHKVKKKVFFNHIGLKKEKGYLIADPERAICDTLYFYPPATFSNIESLSKAKLSEYSKLYDNKRLERSIANILNKY